MKLERNRAERRSKRGVSILYKGIPYLIFAALAAGFLLGAPQLTATSAIAQADKTTVSVLERRQWPFVFAGYLGKTNSVISRGFTEDDFTFSGSYVFLDDGDHNFRLKFKSSGTFIPKKKLVIDLFLVGGGSGGRPGIANLRGGGGGGGGLTGTWSSITLNANQAYPVFIGAGGGNNASGGTSSFNSIYSKSGGTIPANANTYGAHGGSGGGGGDAGTGGSNGSNGISSNYAGGTGQGTNTYEFGDSTLTLYAGGGGAGGGQYSYNGAGIGGAGGGANGGAGAGGNGASAAANTGGGGGGGGSDDDSTTGAGGSGGSGICIIRNHR